MTRVREDLGEGGGAEPYHRVYPAAVRPHRPLHLRLLILRVWRRTDSVGAAAGQA